MRRILYLFMIPLMLLAPSAWANCVGQDMLPELRSSDPAGVETMFARSHAIPNGQGKFWKIEKPGIPTSYLFGTFHAGEVVGKVPGNVWQALETSRIALFELSEDEQNAMNERMATDPTFTLDLSAPPLLDQLTEGQRRVLTKAFTARGMPVQAANQMRPWLLGALLGFPACHLKAAAAGAQVLDNVMVDRAQAQGVRVEGLETYEEALAGFSGFSRDLLIKALIADESFLDREEDIFRTNAELYSAGETAAINELAIWLTERAGLDIDARQINETLMSGLLEGRNREWMGSLAGHLKDGGVFIAVGALHLPGQDGLVELLRAEGYALTRLD